MAATVPAISSAAIMAIKDPQVREVVRAMADGIAVRNGDVGSGENAFLTMGDLTGTGQKIRAVANALAKPLADSMNQPGSEMIRLAEQLEQRIIASPAWQDMFTRIGLLDAPSISPGSVAYKIMLEQEARNAALLAEAKIRAEGLLQEARERGAGIASVNETIQTATTSLASRIDTVTALSNQNVAAISDERKARVDGDTAVASQLTTFIAGTGKDFAAVTASITNEREARVDGDKAVSKELTTFMATTGQNLGAMTALISDERQARADGDSAVSSQLTTFIANTGKDLNAVNSSISTERQARVDGDAAVSRELTTFMAKTGDNLGGMTALISDEKQARVNGDKASADALASFTAATGRDLQKAIADITIETKARVDGDNAVSSQLTTFIAKTGENLAAIQSSLTTRTNSDNALAEAVNTIWGKIGTNTALVTSGTQVVLNNVGSVATKFEQLQAVTTNPVTGLVDKAAALRQEFNVTNTAVDGMKGKWSVKLDLNGYVAGVALNSGVTTGGRQESSFIVLADVFAVGAPGRPDIVPFAIDAQTGLVAIRGDLVVRKSITTEHIAAGSITAASGIIADLAVTTLKIGANSVTVPLFVSGGGILKNLSPGTLKFAGSGTAEYIDDVDIVLIVNWQASAYGLGGNALCQIRINNEIFMHVANSNTREFTTSHVATSKVRLAKGRYTFDIYFGNDWRDGSWDLGYWSSTMLGVMR